MGPSASVVVPARHHTLTLRSAVRSALRQPVDLEVIVVWAGSADETVQVGQMWSDRRVRVIRAVGGIADARNVGWQKARGPVVAFLDGADLWFSNKLPSQLAAMEGGGSSWCYGGGLLFSGDGTLEALLPAPPADAAWRELPYANVVPGGGSNVVVTREALEAVGGFDPSVPHLDDWDLWIRLAQHGPPAVVDSTVLACRHEGRMTHQWLSQLLGSARTLDDRYRGLRQGSSLDWSDLHRWLCHDALRFGHRTIALRLALASVRARHAGRADLALRALLPVRRRAPITSSAESTSVVDRLFPPRLLSWPPGTDAELARLLDSGDGA